MARRPDIVFYLKIFLLQPNPEASRVATSIVCSKSLALLDDAYEKKAIPPPACTTKEIDENLKFNQENGITSAPAIIFPNGLLHFGLLNAMVLEKSIDQATQKQKAGASH